MIIEKNAKKMFRVLSFVTYTTVSNFACIEYLGSDKYKLSDLSLDVTGRYKHLDKKYDNILGFGIPDILLNFCLFRYSLGTMNLFSYSHVLIGCLNNILIKDSFFFFMKTI